MILLNCPHCGYRELVGIRRLRLHNTTAGPIGMLECPAGHHIVHDFHRGRTASVASMGEVGFG